jgi:starch synthase (maltosyl-transferring)
VNSESKRAHRKRDTAGDRPSPVVLSEAKDLLDVANVESQRAIIENVTPQINGGRFPAKRALGDKVAVEADVFTDGHDAIYALLLHRKAGAKEWIETPMQFLVNDHWRAEFNVSELGVWEYTVLAWVDPFLSWRNDLAKRNEPADIALALLTGTEIIETIAARARDASARKLREWTKSLKAKSDPLSRREIALNDELKQTMIANADRSLATHFDRTLRVVVEPERARFSTWYELFPRSCAKSGHGTFKDVEARLPYVAEMGFDVLYFSPIHPIGVTKRKGKNNALAADENDPGSPWAIGAKDGGHKAIHRELGTLDDFKQLLKRGKEYGIDIALDIAFQCAPDHPYVKEHPQWFRSRPDGSVQYAENPPKKYEDIYPFNFESEDWRALWQELKSVFDFWIEQGVWIFRVDNPHTKPFEFWEWVIGEIKKKHPEALFLAEAFTRPRIMHRLAKLGFSQSYTYFAWRNTKWELTEYFTELSQSASREYFRPNVWPNTPDILTEYLQFGGRPAFMARLALAATLSANYGIYGPAFELLQATPREPRSEEYLHSEKYEIKSWDLDLPESLKDYISRVNRIRRENPALHCDWRLRFYPCDNSEIICYGKTSEDLSNLIVAIINLDPYHRQSGFVELPLDALNIDSAHPYEMHDLLSGSHYLWHGARNYVELDPHRSPVHIFRVRSKARTEADFEPFV